MSASPCTGRRDGPVAEWMGHRRGDSCSGPLVECDIPVAVKHRKARKKAAIRKGAIPLTSRRAYRIWLEYLLECAQYNSTVFHSGKGDSAEVS